MEKQINYFSNVAKYSKWINADSSMQVRCEQNDLV